MTKAAPTRKSDDAPRCSWAKMAAVKKDQFQESDDEEFFLDEISGHALTEIAEVKAEKAVAKPVVQRLPVEVSPGIWQVPPPPPPRR